MKRIALILTALCFGGLTAVAQEQRMAEATFVDGDGKAVGKAMLKGTPQGVLFEIEVSGLPAERWLAVHVHETGACDPADGFKSAGGHFDPTGRAHGYLTEGGPHAGDMPNQYVGTDGVMHTQVFNSFVTLGKGEGGVLGRSIVIHEKADDYRSQPTGEAGGRLTCAVVR